MAPPMPPRLMDDLIGEILLRLPPDDPTCLVRASLVCKSWRSLVSDGAFLREYRAFHRTPPLLGFFQDQRDDGEEISVPCFVPTTTINVEPVPLSAAIACGSSDSTSFCTTLDCRHGRVLSYTEVVRQGQLSQELTVWDPLTGDHKCFSAPSDVEPYYEFTGAVLCASAACDHLECSRGPLFLVVLAGIGRAGDDHQGDFVTWARAYSSETDMWGARITLDLDSFIIPGLPSLLVGDAIYFILEHGERILKYDLVMGALSVIEESLLHEGSNSNMILTTARDGELGAATVEGYSLRLWSWRPDQQAANDGIGKWALVREIDLEAMIPLSIGDPSIEFFLGGFAEGAGLIYICPNDDIYDDIFTVELKSGHIRKICKRRNFSGILPLMSFCTPDRVSAESQVPMMID